MKGEVSKCVFQRVNILLFFGLPSTIDKDKIPVNNDNAVSSRGSTISKLSLQWTSHDDSYVVL